MRICLKMLCGMLAVSSVLFASESGRTYHDRAFVQDYCEKIPLSTELEGTKLLKVRADRNGLISVLSGKGLLQIHSGTLRRCMLHRPISDMHIRDIDVHDGQFVYLTDEMVLSNEWAGRFLVQHDRADAKFVVMGENLDFALVAGSHAAYLNNGGLVGGWKDIEAEAKQCVFDGKRSRFFFLTDKALSCLERDGSMKVVFRYDNMNCLAITNDSNMLLIGTSDGYLTLNAGSFEQSSGVEKNLPCADVRCIENIDGRTWFGTPKGAFALNPGGRIDYYASQRWLVDDYVIDISHGPDGSVLILTRGGLSVIRFKEMTLAQKADHFDRLTRKRHIRYGFNSAFVMSKPGDLSTGTLIDQDNDGLWTAMYLAGELFRYAVTKSDEALRNCHESFEAMERLTEITSIEGFPARSFDRAGYQVADKKHWHTTADGQWAWKGTTSSDEIVGHFFVYTIFAEIIPDDQLKARAVALMDAIMDHIVRNNWYLIDYDGKPTLWGRWHPEYVNKFPRQVGDRRLNSVEIISFLQAAYHFTGKEVYKEKAYELLDDHGYLDNIMIPITEIGRVSGIDLTTEWNHSDDELAFLSYWNLYRYAFTEELRDKYRRTIKGHWEIERPEKNPLWSFIYADTGEEQFDLQEAIWSLKEFPLDMIGWTVRNSHRKDVELLGLNFRQQTIRSVLPPDDRPMSKYNGNAFRLDGGENGGREYSGDIYLLPYWMGRYLEIIR